MNWSPGYEDRLAPRALGNQELRDLRAGWALKVSVGYLDQRVSVVMPACQDFQAPWDLKVPQDLRVLKERGEKLGKEFRANKGTPESQVLLVPQARELWVALEKGETLEPLVNQAVPDPQEKQDPPDIVNTVTLHLVPDLEIIYNLVQAGQTPKAKKTYSTFVNSITFVISFICIPHTFFTRHLCVHQSLYGFSSCI